MSRFSLPPTRYGAQYGPDQRPPARTRILCQPASGHRNLLVIGYEDLNDDETLRYEPFCKTALCFRG